MELRVSIKQGKRLRFIALLVTMFAGFIGLATALDEGLGLTILGRHFQASGSAAISIVALLLAFYIDTWIYRMQHSSELEELREAVRSGEQSTKRLEAQLVSSVRREFERVQALPVRVYLMSNILIYAPLYIAMRLNFFKEEGLDVTLHSCLTDKDSVVALKARQDGFAVCDPLAVLEADPDAHSASMATTNIRIISPFINKASILIASCEPLEQLISESEADARPIRLLTYAEGSTSFNLAGEFAKRLREKGISVDVTPINREFDDVARAQTPDQAARRHYDSVRRIMEREKFDAVVFVQPDIDWVASRYGYVHTRPLHGQLYSEEEFFAFTAVLTTTELLAAAPDVARRFLKALRMAMKFVYALPPLPIGAHEILQDLSLDEKEELKKVVTHTMEWERAVDAVLKTTQDVYPGIELKPLHVAFILEWMRRNSHFSRGLYFDDRIDRGFNHAKAAHPKGAGWDVKRLLHPTDLYA